MPVYKVYDSIPAFSFHVSIGGVEVGFFTECEGLTFEREVVEFKEGGTNDFVHMLPGPIKLGTVTLKRGTDPELKLLDWFNKGAVNGRMARQDVSVIVYNRNRKPMIRLDLVDAFPSKYDGPSLKVEDVAPAVETLSIVHGGQSSSGSGSGGGGSGGGADYKDEERAEANVDIRALADSVYQLLKHDARLERERRGLR